MAQTQETGTTMTPRDQAASRVFLFSSVLLVLLAAEYWITRSYFFNENPELISLGVALDITLGVPILFYFFIAKPRKYSALSLLPVFLASIALAAFMLPADHQTFLSKEKKIIPFIEVAAVLYICFKIPGIWKRYKNAKETELYISDAFEAAAGDMMRRNRLIKIVLTEFLLMYLAFGGWFKKYQKSGSFSTFTYHQKSSYSTILGVMSFLLIVETVGLHLIVMHWSVMTANIITALSIYGLIWLIGDFHAIRLHPVILTEHDLLLRTGIRWRATIPISEIADVEIGSKPRKNKSYLRASVLYPRVIVHLHHPIPVKGLFGMLRHPSRLGLSIDDPEQFKSEILKRQ
ncbi:MAG TPA: hypothetical protein VLH08_08995 [Acidobacteriota bacterium]|nr:hypothetical protein [Acidobacteriota bacterium]